MPRNVVALFLVFLLTNVPAALAQNSASSALINQQLDRQTSLNHSGSLPEVMAQIAKQTGVPLEAQPSVWELLPWGRDTTVTAKIENQTLRQALNAITHKLGLTYELKNEAVELQPMPALRRLGRKSTVAELQALDLLSSTPLDLKIDKPTLKALVEAIDAKLQAVKSPLATVNRSATAADKVPQDSPVAVARNASLLDGLEALAQQTSATWYPWDKSIIVLSKQDQTQRLLQKEITLRPGGVDVAQVLSELSTRTGVPFRYEPGTFQELSPQSRNINLVINATAVDALEAISGLTGLGYQVKENEVYIYNTASAAVHPRDPVIAMVPTPSGMQVFITESQCPPDVREYMEFQKKKHYDALRKMMTEEGFKPTNPATQPAPPPGKPAPAKPAAPVTSEPAKDL